MSGELLDSDLPRLHGSEDHGHLWSQAKQVQTHSEGSLVLQSSLYANIVVGTEGCTISRCCEVFHVGMVINLNRGDNGVTIDGGWK